MGLARPRTGVIGVAILLILASSCGDPGAEPQVGSETSVNPDCVPGSVVGEPLSNPDRRIEDIIEFLTGERQTGDTDPVEETITDPNFGGVWGDFQGGIVVAVLDCTLIDADELARIAGGDEYLHLIEVLYTYRQVVAFRDTLVRELRALDLVIDVRIESTLKGRVIEVRVLDAHLLTDTFAPEVPRDAYVVIESDTVGTTPAG
jgi:hypothetical protein